MLKKIKNQLKKLRYLRKLIPTRQSHILHHIGAIVFALGVFILAVQLIYPTDRVLPYIRVNGETVSGMSRRQLIDYLYNRYSDAPLTVKVDGKKIETQVNEAGLIIDYIDAVDKALSYKGWERAVPYSSIVKIIWTDIQVQVIPDKERLQKFVNNVVGECLVAPKNAGVTVEGQMIKLVPASSGASCSPGETEKKLLALKVTKKNEVAAPVTEQKPQRTNEDVIPRLQDARKLVDSGLQVAVVDKFHNVPKETVASWLDFVEGQDKQIIISLKAEKVAEYLGGLNGAVYVAPGVTTVYLVDGQEVRRAVGRNGQGIDNAATTERIKAALFKPDAVKPVAWAAIAKLEPSIAYSRNYSHTQFGLELFLKDLAAEKGGYGIALAEITGPGRSASANGSKTFTTASTYKMFVAYAVTREIDAGRMSWGEEIANGRSAAQCFNDMIVLSDNPCAETFGTRIGWINIQNQMHALGLTSTFLPRGNFRSTALDEALFMQKLERGETFGGEHRSRLLDAMKRQVYRAGIPKGVQGAVADKVGFLEGYLNDAAIVYGRQGTYALVILSNGSSWGQIADAAKRIDAYLNE